MKKTAPSGVRKWSGFTLIELLVVMAILGVLVTIAIVSFRSSQIRGRDAQRKADLKQVSSSLELFYADYSRYPDGIDGIMQACPYNLATQGGGVCTWGSGEFTDGKTVYFKSMPEDPSTGQNYYYRVVDPPSNQKYQIFAFLENTEDRNCLGGDCVNSPVTHSCGIGKLCNFAITSPNTSATE